MSYTQYGIKKALVEQVKKKLKNRTKKERVKALLKDVTKADLQDRSKVSRLLMKAAAILEVPMNATEREQIVKFIVSQNIDPDHTFQLIKLWHMFR